MCFYSKLTQDALKVANRFKAKFTDENLYTPREIINGFEHSANPIITNRNTSVIQFFNWGLIPENNYDFNIRKLTLNARIETIDKVNSFKNILTNRCIIPADGFYEWKHISNRGKTVKEKYLITSADDEIFSFAGLYSSWLLNDGQYINTYSILTTEANELMSEIHNTKKRMPVILRSGDEMNWLDGQDYRDFSLPYQVNLNISRIL